MGVFSGGRSHVYHRALSYSIKFLLILQNVEVKGVFWHYLFLPHSWNVGIMEYWIKKRKEIILFAGIPIKTIVPSFQYSHIPMCISLALFLTVTLLSSLCLAESKVEKEHFISLKDGLISIQAKEVTVESVFKDLGEVCGMKIVSNEHAFPSSPVSVKFDNLPLTRGVKKLIKVTGVKNYIIQYQEVGNRSYISEIEFLGSKGDSRILTPGRALPVRQAKAQPKRPAKKPKSDSRPEKDIEEKIDNLEDRFEWDDGKTVEMVKELLRAAPPNVRDYALDSMTKSINDSLKKEGSESVSREMIYKAAEDATPPNMPAMKEGIIKYLDSMSEE